MTPSPTYPSQVAGREIPNLAVEGSTPSWGAMRQPFAEGVPEEGHYGVAAANPYQDGSGGVPSPFGSPPAIWCTKLTASGEPCRGKHLPDKDYCFAHAQAKE